MTDEKNSLHGVEKMFHYFVRDVSSESFLRFAWKDVEIPVYYTRNNVNYSDNKQNPNKLFIFLPKHKTW